MRALVFSAIVTTCLSSVWAQVPSPAVFTVETDGVKWAFAGDGKNLHFIDKQSGADYLDSKTASCLMMARKAGKDIAPTKATLADGQLDVVFGDSGIRVVARVKTEKRYFLIEVVSVTGSVDELSFLNVPLISCPTVIPAKAGIQSRENLDSRFRGNDGDAHFAACALALNLKTNITEIPGPMKRLHASCYPKFGIEGAKAAVIGCPQANSGPGFQPVGTTGKPAPDAQNQPASMPGAGFGKTGPLRDIMKEVVAAADELPKTNIGGPWALDAAINRGSYVFDFGAISETTVDDWIAFAKTLGMNQIDFHTGSSLRFGDCRPNPTLYPKGYASLKAVIDKLHAAGIRAGLHTYSFFMAKDTPYVTPVPDARLGKDATFTLAEPLTADAKLVAVGESTKDVSTITGFFVRNSVTIQVDNELINYGGATKAPPFQFTQCTRGAYGTKPAAHNKGAKAYHLKECFGLFTPDADSTLLTEVAANTARAYNECGFDMIYLDALDGEGILGGDENAWHYGSKFVFDIANRLKKPALFEMSTFHHHLWYVRSRMGAWDHPTRSYKGYIDLHCKANYDGRGMFLPMNLGWWAVQVWNEANATQTEPTYPDDIEYLMGKCLGYGMGISLMGVNPDTVKSVPAYQRLAPIFRQYEELRHADYFPESVKAKLRVPKDEYKLEKADDAPASRSQVQLGNKKVPGKWQFRPVQYDKHKVQGINGWSNVWTAKNKFAAQPVQVRIEALMAAGPYDAPEATIVEDFAKPDVFADRASESGVTANLDISSAPPSRSQVQLGNEKVRSGRLTASSDRANPDGAWARIVRKFTPPLNVAKQQCLGVWVYGDGQGELLNLQLRSPLHTTDLGMGDHYVEINFTGWRYFELIELEGGHVADFAWPYSGNSYAIYRESVNYGQIETFGLWLNRLPQGKKVECFFSPIKALPLVKTKLKNPKLKIGDASITFPAEIESGSYLEFKSMTDCKLYGPNGALLSEIKPEGAPPTINPGDNPIEFTCESPAGISARANVTIITRGEPIK